MTNEKNISPSKEQNQPRALYLSIPILLFVILASISCQKYTGYDVASAPVSGEEIFRSKCHECHAAESSMEEYRSEATRYLTIYRIKNVDDPDISRNETDLLVEKHVEHQREEGAIFKEKCQRCHPGKVFLQKKMSENQARAIIKRMQQKAGNTIEDQDIEIIVNYHVQVQKTALEDALRGLYSQLQESNPTVKRGMVLFVKSCSSCHQLSKAFTVFKNPGVWQKTIHRMQSYSKGEITDQEAEELVDFHVSEQQREIVTFQRTCTKCHDDDRINNRSLSEEQWLEKIRKMQRKAPDFITEEKVILLSMYLYRREVALTNIFFGKCQLCHLENSRVLSAKSDTGVELNKLIALANDEFGKSLQITDINNIKKIHTERQKRNMVLYESCTFCHIDGIPKKEKLVDKKPSENSRAKWIAFIITLQGLDFTNETQVATNSLIEYHVAKY